MGKTIANEDVFAKKCKKKEFYIFLSKKPKTDMNINYITEQ